MLEELGHALDWRINGSNDTAGDEGAIFSALIRAVAIPIVETSQNDHHTPIINGQRIAVQLPHRQWERFLTAIAEDSSDPAGDTVANLFASSFSDTDDDTLQAIAVTANAANPLQKVLGSTTDSGSSWTTIATSGLSDSAAIYLSGDTKIRFLPVGDQRDAWATHYKTN